MEKYITNKKGETFTVLIDEEDEELYDRYRWCVYVGKLKRKFNFKLFNNFGNKTINHNHYYPEVDKKQLKDVLLTNFSDKKSYKREEIADKINKLL